MSPLIRHPQVVHIPRERETEVRQAPPPAEPQASRPVIHHHNVTAAVIPDKFIRGLLLVIAFLLLLVFLHGHGWAQNIPPARLQGWNAVTTQWQNILVDNSTGYLPVICESGCSGATLPTSVTSGQQAVTATAAALATHTLTSGICVEALSTNAISVFVGPSGVTTSTGQEIPAGAATCIALSNSNEIYVVASTTGATVTWLGN